MNDVERKPLRAEGSGLLEAWINLSVGLAERGVHGATGFARDVTNETSNVLDSTLGWADAVSHSSVKLLRVGVRHAAYFWLDVIDFGENGVMQTIRVLGATSRDATSLASRAATGFTRSSETAAALS